MENAIHTLTAVVAKAKAGDKHAMSMLYDRFSQAMYNTSIRLLNSREDAEDVLQDSFFIAFSKIGQLKNTENFGGWLKTIVVNECINHCKRHKFLLIEDSFEEVADNEEADENSIWEIDAENVLGEIAELPAGYRQVFTLYAIEDYRHSVIAEMLGISESTSKTQYFKAKQLLRTRLLKYQLK